MSSRRVLIAWLVSILFVLVSAASNWVKLTLVPEAGSQVIAISGFTIFPVAGALLLLQSAAVLATLLTKPVVGRIVRVALVPVVSWQLVISYLNLSGAVDEAIAAEISKLTGISGVLAQEDLVSGLTTSMAPMFYLVALLLNVAVLLVTAAFANSKSNPKQSLQANDSNDSWELWEGQRAG